jgi:hypothetical protein
MIKQFFLKLFGKQCDECKQWFWKIKPIAIYEDAISAIKINLCNQCKQFLGE